jgi:putative DNA primase/helicase
MGSYRGSGRMICPHCQKKTHTKWFKDGVGQCEHCNRIIQYKFDQTQMLKEDTLSLIIQKRKTEATEKITEAFKKNNHIYTTRDDEHSEIWIYKEGIYIPQGKTYIKEFSREILGEAYTTNFCNQIIAKIEADTYIDQEELFNQVFEDEICCENGIINLKTRKLSEFDPKKIFFTKIPVTYNAKAVCPSIETHFKTVLKNETDSEVMFELFGFLLYKNYFLEKAAMFIGDGRNGKGKTIDLMKRFVGVDNCASVPLQDFEKDHFAAGELFNKLANLPGDLDDKALSHTGMFKTLTGRDLISAPRKFLTRVKFVNFAKMVFACNKLPRTKDTTTAFWNRWVLFEFPYTFLNEKEINELSEKDKKNVKLKDPNIIEKLSTPEELSGLLNRSLDGLQRLFKGKDFSHSQGVKEIKDLWIRKSDSFLAYCLDYIEEDDEVRIEKKNLRLAYAKYCKLHKIKPVSDKVMRETLYENFAVSEDRAADGLYYWEGIRFKDGKTVELITAKVSQH